MEKTVRRKFFLGYLVSSLVVDPGEIEPRRDPVHVKVHGHGDDVEVARAFAVAKQCALHALCAGQ